MDYGYASQYARSADISSVESAEVLATSLETLGTVAMVMGLISLAIIVLQYVAMWKIFVKAGEKGWKALIPIYNLVVMFKIIGISPLLLLIFLATIIPVIGYFAVLGLNIYYNIMLGKAFGKSGAFTAGLILLGPIFYMILGFGSSTYQGATAKV